MYPLRNSTITLSNCEYKKETNTILSFLFTISLLSLFVQCVLTVLFQIGYTKSSIFHTFAFPITASSNSHIYYYFNYPNLSIHSPSYFLFSRQKSPKSTKSQIPFYITNGFFWSEVLAFKRLLSLTCFTSWNSSSQFLCSSHIVEGTFVSVQLFIDCIGLTSSSYRTI